MAKVKKITFPFKPNKRTREAFAREAKNKKMIKLIIETIAGLEIFDAWEVAKQEHPELLKCEYNTIRYAQISETINLLEKEDK